MHNDADRKAQSVVNRSHPLGVAARQVVVHRHDVYAAPGQGVQIRWKRGDERLAFAGLHFGDFALVQNDSADQLHIEMAHAERTPARLAHQSKGGDQCGLECIRDALLVIGLGRIGIANALLHFELELLRFGGQVGVGEAFVVGGELVDRSYLRRETFDVALVLCANKPGDNPVHYLFNSHAVLVGCSSRASCCNQVSGAGADAGSGVMQEAPKQKLFFCRCRDLNISVEVYPVGAAGAKARMASRIVLFRGEKPVQFPIRLKRSNFVTR